MNENGAGESAIEAVFREEYGRISASIIRAVGDFDTAEEALQDAFIEALDQWRREGVPRNPAAWLTHVARRRAIDRLRHAKVRDRGAARLRDRVPTEDAPIERLEAMLDSSLEDDRLRLIFTCCHPALSPEAHVPLTLRSLCGLETAEIARAFLVPEATLAQRLVRAKKKIREAGVPYRVPPDHLLPERLSSVLAACYLVFNEGYSATSGPELVRTDLTLEAIRLARLLAELMPDEPEALGLLALMLLQNSRRAARVSDTGELVLLADQDRALWDRPAIEEGRELVERALRMQRPGPYQLQAAIAAVHSESSSADDTDWAQIVRLYDELLKRTPSPVVALNRAVAVAMAQGAQAGLEALAPVAKSGALEEYHLYHATRADFLGRLGREEESRAGYARALELARTDAERAFLRRHL